MAGSDLDQLGLLVGAVGHGRGTAGVKAAPGRQGRKVGGLAGDGLERRLAAQLGDGIQKGSSVRVPGVVEQVPHLYDQGSRNSRGA